MSGLNLRYHRFLPRALGTFIFITPLPSYSTTTEISGLLEAELYFGDNFQGQSSSDIVLATVEIGLDSEISEWYSGHILLLYEEDVTDLEVDEGYIKYGNAFLSSFSVKAGQMYTPFGLFETGMVSDPLTMELGETRESTIVATYDNGFLASVYLFNGDLMEPGGDNTIDNFGVMLGYVYQSDTWMFDVGFGYINNIAESDALSERVRNNLGNNAIDYIPGTAAHLTVRWGSWQFISEVVAATDEFNTGEIQAFRASKPSATNIEFGYAISDALNVAAGFQNTVDLAGVNGLPESRLLLGLSYKIDQATTIAFEYVDDSDYSTADGGSGETASTTTIQFAAEF